MATNILDDLLKLPDDERREIALALWESLPDDNSEVSFEFTPELKAEIDRRITEHDADPNSAIPWEAVRTRLRNRR